MRWRDILSHAALQRPWVHWGLWRLPARSILYGIRFGPPGNSPGVVFHDRYQILPASSRGALIYAAAFAIVRCDASYRVGQ